MEAAAAAGTVLPDPLQQLRHAGTEKALSILQKAGCQLQFHGIPPVGLIKSLYHIPPELQTGKETWYDGTVKNQAIEPGKENTMLLKNENASIDWIL